jgi:hypothetical protein
MPEPMEDPNTLDMEVIPIEDLEGEGTTEEEVKPEGKTESEGATTTEDEDKIPEHVPYSRFQEVYHKGKQADETARALYAQNQQLMQILLNAQQQVQSRPQQAPSQKVDPEAEAFIKLIKPALDQENRPLLERIAQQEQIIQNLAQQSESQAAWVWLQGNVPDLNEIAPDLLAYIDSRPDKNAILSDPNRVYDAAQIVRLSRQAGGKKQDAGVKDALRQESRSRGRAELPNTQTRTSTKDWSKVSDQDFAEAMRQAGF